MSIWHKEISSAIDAVVDNPAIVRLYRQWLAASQACAPGWPALADFDPRAANWTGLQSCLMLLAQQSDDLRYLHYGTDIQRHTQFDMTGQCVSAFGGELAAFFQRCYDQVLQTGQPLYTVHSSVKAKTVFTWERLILPVRDEMGRSHLCVYNQPLETRAHILEVVLQTARDALLVLRNQPPDAADAAASARTAFAAVTNPAMTDAEKKKAVAILRAPGQVNHIAGMLSEYDWEFVEQSKEIRGFVVAKLLEETKHPDARIRLKAIELLGKITEVGAFTERIQVTKVDATMDELQARLHAKLTSLLPKVVEVETAIPKD